MKKIILIIVLLAGVFTVYNYSRKVSDLQSAKTVKKITIEQKLDNDKSFTRYEINSGNTALDLLEQSSKAETRGEGENAYITSINGRKADETKKEFWSFYINGKMSPVGAGSYQLKNGDKIEWKIEKY